MNQINIRISSVDSEDADALMIPWDPNLMRTFSVATDDADAFHKRTFHQNVKLSRNARALGSAGIC